LKLSTHAQDLLTRLRPRRARPEQARASSAWPERDPVVRRMNFRFDPAEIPRHWIGGNAVATAIGNSLNLVFPDGERFFVRSVNHYLDEVDDPELRDRVKRFFGQEGQHAKEHERVFELLRAHGYDIDAFLVPYRHLAYEVLAPRFSPKLRLAITAALEHFTAAFADHALTSPNLHEMTSPAMAELLMWHAAEEIEHKDVAYDVLQAVDDSYLLRVAGLVTAVVGLWGFWTFGVVSLLRQEPDLDLGQALRDFAALRAGRTGPASKGPAAFLQYLAWDFHPAKVENDALARDYFDEIGRRYA
jgi:predicted metal-dependent hydrolase